MALSLLTGEYQVEQAMPRPANRPEKPDSRLLAGYYNWPLGRASPIGGYLLNVVYVIAC
jgi:hypothetical protein